MSHHRHLFSYTLFFRAMSLNIKHKFLFFLLFHWKYVYFPSARNFWCFNPARNIIHIFFIALCGSDGSGCVGVRVGEFVFVSSRPLQVDNFHSDWKLWMIESVITEKESPNIPFLEGGFPFKTHIKGKLMIGMKWNSIKERGN